MKKLLIFFLIYILLATPVNAIEIEPVTGPSEAEAQLPDTFGSFWSDLRYVLTSAVGQLSPYLREAASVCMRVFAAVFMLSFLQAFEGISKKAVEMIASVVLAGILLGTTGTMVDLATDTVLELTEYGKLLLPVMTTALAAQGGTTTATALYAGTSLFNTVLTSLMSGLLVPMVYIFLVLSVVADTVEAGAIAQLRDFIKWLMTWLLRVFLYVFVGFISITGVISGTTDQMTLKATKLTISGAVPVVGGILSDASEALLVSIGVMKNTAGIYGILVIAAIFLVPFLRIGLQYLLWKLSGGLCRIISGKPFAVIDRFAYAMGYLLGMTGAVCCIQLISIICFMKGMQA